MVKIKEILMRIKEISKAKWKLIVIVFMILIGIGTTSYFYLYKNMLSYNPSIKTNTNKTQSNKPTNNNNPSTSQPDIQQPTIPSEQPFVEPERDYKVDDVYLKAMKDSKVYEIKKDNPFIELYPNTTNKDNTGKKTQFIPNESNTSTPITENTQGTPSSTSPTNGTTTNSNSSTATGTNTGTTGGNTTTTTVQPNTDVRVNGK